MTASKLPDNTMKTPAPELAMFVLVGLLISPPALVHASSSSPDSVHFCVPFDYEQWRADHPRPAAKRPADLNVGQPRTVRMIYFLPNDRPFRQEVVDSMKTVIKRVQTFYAEQMQAHGLGYRTFRIETDALVSRRCIAWMVNTLRVAIMTHLVLPCWTSFGRCLILM